MVQVQRCGCLRTIGHSGDLLDVVVIGQRIKGGTAIAFQLLILLVTGGLFIEKLLPDFFHEQIIRRARVVAGAAVEVANEVFGIGFEIDVGVEKESVVTFLMVDVDASVGIGKSIRHERSTVRVGTEYRLAPCAGIVAAEGGSIVEVGLNPHLT